MAQKVYPHIAQGTIAYNPPSSLIGDFPAAGGTATATSRADTSPGSASDQQGRNTTAGGTAIVCGAFITPPLSADFTISGTITYNFWASESNMSANAGMACAVYKLAYDTGELTLINQSADGVELGTSMAAMNWTASPTSTDMVKGDRLVIVPYFTNVGTMAAGHSMLVAYDGPTGGATGDTWVQFNENLTFQTETAPGGSTIYPTSVVSSVSVGVDEREMWTSRGSGDVLISTNTVAGPTSPFQATISAGGSVVEWYSKPVEAFTLSGLIECNLRGTESNSAANAAMLIEVARVNGDGSSPTVFGVAYRRGTTTGTSELHTSTEIGSTPTYLAGPDLAFSDGQRIRLRVYWDDARLQTPVANMASGHTAGFRYGATSGGVSGDSWLKLGQTLVEFTGAIDIAPSPVATTLTAPAPTIGLGAVTISPAPIAADANPVAPTLALSNTIAPAPVPTSGAVTSPTIGLGALALTPAPVPAVTAVPAPTVAVPINISPAPVATSLAVTAPTLGLSLALSPAPVTAPVVVTTPAIALSLALSPAPVAADANPVAVTVATGAIALSPAPVPVIGAVTSPALGLSLALSPAPVAVDANPVAPTVTTGAIALTPAPIPTVGTVTAPTIGLSLTLTPPPVPAVAAVPTPTVDVVGGGGAITITPDPVGTITTVPAPDVATGAIALTPAPVATTAATAAPTLALTLALAPAPVVADTNITSSTLGLSLALAPSPIGVVPAVTVPTIHVPFTVTLAPGPVAAQLTVVQPFVVVGAPSGFGVSARDDRPGSRKPREDIVARSLYNDLIARYGQEKGHEVYTRMRAEAKGPFAPGGKYHDAHVSWARGAGVVPIRVKD